MGQRRDRGGSEKGIGGVMEKGWNGMVLSEIHWQSGI